MDDCKKLRRYISYLNQTLDDAWIIEVFNLTDLFTWVDVSYAVHSKIHSYTGGFISLGCQMLYSRSSKKKLNAKDSNEAVLIGTSEYVLFNVWMVMFLEAQGYNINNNIILQYIQITKKTAKNGRYYCTGNSRYINICYFFVKDRVDKIEIEVRYCPTNLMIADYFTKPLRGKMFKMFRDLIMGYLHINDLL